MKWHTKCWLVLLVLALLCAGCGVEETPVGKTPTKKASVEEWELLKKFEAKVDLSGESRFAEALTAYLALDASTLYVKIVLEFIPSSDNKSKHYTAGCWVGDSEINQPTKLLVMSEELRTTSIIPVVDMSTLLVCLAAGNLGDPPQPLRGTIVVEIYRYIGD